MITVSVRASIFQALGVFASPERMLWLFRAVAAPVGTVTAVSCILNHEQSRPDFS